MKSLPVSFEDIERAASLIRGQVEETPCVHTRTLSQITGADVYLKLENLQFTASFKDRGALVKLLALSERERAGGVIAMSAGNHAQAVAYHARRLGIPAVIVMPRFTPAIKTERTRAFGAEVILHGDSFDAAGAHARQLADERGLLMVHPYDDEKVIAGQGTAALEMLQACPQIDTLVVPVGGGGLIAGSAIAARAINPDIRVVGVETEHFPAMRRALDGVAPHFGAFTIADGIAVKQPGGLTLPVVRELVDEIVLVDEETLERAVLLFLEVEKTVVEGAGAAGLAALLRYPAKFSGARAGVMVSGGNIDLPILSYIIQRGLVRSRQLVRIQVEVRDAPGSLAGVAALIAESGANVVGIRHHRTFAHVPLQSVQIEFALQTRGEEHLRELLQILADAGHRPELLDTPGDAP